MVRTLLYSMLIFTGIQMYSQDGYPVPEKTEHHLFYIQHSNNHNTYVYEANVRNDSIVASAPIIKYRITYAGKGEKKPLTLLQRQFAYGMTLEESSPNLFKLRLAATNKIDFYLFYDQEQGAKMYVTVKNRKIYVSRMFVQLKNSNTGLNSQVDYIVVYGRDFYTKKLVEEKVYLD